MPETPLPNIPDKFKLTPEFKLLVACSWIAPPSLEQDQAQKIVSLSSGEIDWDAFIVLVRRHGVTSLAYTMLCKHAGERLPGNIRDILKADHIQAAGQSLRQMAELSRISKLFKEHSIEMIPLKGVLLSQLLYGNPTMRNSCDLDILIRPEEVARVDNILKEAGYRCIFPGFAVTAKQMNYLSSGVHHFEYSHQESRVQLEVHWSSYLWTSQNAAELWRDYRELEMLGETFSCMNYDAQILFLADHGARHKWFCLKWLSDIVALLSQERKEDWNSLLVLADRLDMKRVLAQTVLLVEWLYDFPVPEQLRRVENDEQLISNMASQAMTKIFATNSDILSEGKRMETFNNMLYWRKLKPSLSYSLLLKCFFIRPQDFKLLSLPSNLFWLYVPFRPVLWFWRNYFIKH